MKKKILVDLPDNLIDIEVKKLIKSQTNKISRLEAKIDQLESTIINNKNTVARAHQLVQACKEAGDFYYSEDDDYGDEL